MSDQETQNAPAAAEEQTEEQTNKKLLNEIVANLVPKSPSPVQRTYATDLVRAFIAEVEKNEMTPGAAKDSASTIDMLQARIDKIDGMIAAQLDEILHSEEFQKLEASWRGLHYLVMNTETSTRLKLRLLPISPKELKKDLGPVAVVDFNDQTQLFKKVYEEEYGTYGGHPFSLLVGDYEFGRSPEDMDLLTNISRVAATAHAPFLAAASPELFDMKSFTELGKPRDLAKLFESTELKEWGAFQQTEDSRYATLVLPHILLRLPYGPKTEPVDGFKYEENTKAEADDKTAVRDSNGRDHKKYLWGNAAYALAQRITNAFALYGWCAAIRGVEGGGMVRNLPTHNFENDEKLKVAKCPTEVAITDRREKELDTLGFVSLCHCKGENHAVFFGGQTTQKPKKWDTDAANANSRISARLPYILAASRFAHYLKVICRDKIGSFQTKETLSDYLNRWISGYILGTDNAGQEVKAQYPLREARIDVAPIPGSPGAFKAVAFLRPHFQLEELTTSVRLVAELPPPAA